MVEPINRIVAENLKRLREARKLSLEALSKATGVSKSMLGQIERGDVSPTISTVWKISNGLRVPFSELMTRPEVDYEVIERTAVHPLTEDDGRYRNYPLFPFDSTRRFEVYAIELDPGARLQAEAHPDGTQEFITLFGGRLRIVLDDTDVTLSEGNAIRFRADQPHRYENAGDILCTLSLIIYYP